MRCLSLLQSLLDVAQLWFATMENLLLSCLRHCKLATISQLTFSVRIAPISTLMSMVIVAKVHRFVQSGIYTPLVETRAHASSRNVCAILDIYL
jgi:Na+-translocating ferredoxin:NAD+ oxidoreductase RnfE subunit